MKEKRYCFQCHNSAYISSESVHKTQSFGEKVCLYCFVIKAFRHKKSLIAGCVYCEPESVEKLRLGLWNARTSQGALEYKRFCTQRKQGEDA